MAYYTAQQIQQQLKRQVGVPVAPNFVVNALFEQGAELTLTVTPDMKRLGDTLSGPVLMAAADVAMYAAIIAHVADGENAVTSHLNIEFLRRPPLVDLRIRAYILRSGRRHIACRVELLSGDTLVAHVTGAYARMLTPTSGV